MQLTACRTPGRSSETAAVLGFSLLIVYAANGFPSSQLGYGRDAE
jgi:hypothetical protein